MSELPKLVYVDDEEDIREVAEFALEDDFNVKIFSSADEFLTNADELAPDIILLDVMMPEMDGPSLFQKIKEIPHLQSIPTIFMTAKVQPQEVKELMEIGAKAVIAKPFDPLELPNQIANYIED